MLEDRYGLPLGTASGEARDAYVRGVDCLLAAQPGADAAFAQAVAADPDFALAHAGAARVAQMNNRMAEAQAAATEATRLAAAGDDRIRGHVAIFDHLVHGRGVAAREATVEHLARWPRDAVALSPSVGVFGLYGFSGRIGREPELAALLESLAGHYGDDWWFASALAFAEIENDRAEQGLERIERSLALRADNANAVHIKAHALYELGRDAPARAMLEPWLAGYSEHGKMHCHLWWHMALTCLFAGEWDAMWTHYQRHCAPPRPHSPPINVVTDGVSLLWRARLAGADCDPAWWQRLREFANAQFPSPGVFIDVHYGFCLAALDDAAAITDYLGALERAGPVAGGVVMRIIQGAQAFVQGDMNRVVATLEPSLDDVVRIGGSRAQRDLVLCTLAAAQLRRGRADAARRLLARRGPRATALPLEGFGKEH